MSRSLRHTLRGPSIAAAAAMCCAVLPGQNRSEPDQRDAVTLKSGKVVLGRVVNPFWQDEVVLRIGGQRRRFPKAEVRNVHTVHDDLRQFYKYRDALGGNPKRSWFLVEWARSKGLAGMARLQALAIVLADPKAEQARRFLGHRQVDGRWGWPVEDRRGATLEEHDEHYGKWGRALELTGEHFRVKTNAGIARAVETLFDLERLYLFWMDVFGAGLDMQEPAEPIDVHVWAAMSEFPKLSARPLPYYDLRGAVAKTFYRPDGERPDQLFPMATQALIYATLVEARPVHERAHLCAFAEVGLGLWVESAFDGKPGLAVPLAEPRLAPLTASAVFRSRLKLNRVIHLHYELYYELSDRVAIRWSATETLVHFLMSRKPDPKLRDRFFAYLHRVFRKGLGDSSTAFDKAMGMPIESLQPKFQRWLQVRQ